MRSIKNALVVFVIALNLSLTLTSACAQDTIKIASFNIQVFGQAKADKPEVMAILAQTIAGFDIVAIQKSKFSDSPNETVMGWPQ